jgi:hypothetical protein
LELKGYCFPCQHLNHSCGASSIAFTVFNAAATAVLQKSLDFRLDSDSSWLDGVNAILKQEEPNLPKQDYGNPRAIASLANALITVMEPVPTPLLSSMLLL